MNLYEIIYNVENKHFLSKIGQKVGDELGVYILNLQLYKRNLRHKTM